MGGEGPGLGDGVASEHRQDVLREKLNVALVQLLDFSVIAPFSLPPSMARHFCRAGVAMRAD